MTWEEIPLGICLIKMLHERTGKYCLHLHLKINEGEWFEQIDVPALSQESTMETNRDFWTWAENNLPIYDHQKPVKSAHASS
jgi:hypothetical protein